MLVPIYVAALSVIILISQSVLEIRQQGRLSRQLWRFDPEQETRDATVDITSSASWHRQNMQGILNTHGSKVAYLLNVLRFVLCLVLLGVSIYTAYTMTEDSLKGLPLHSIQAGQGTFYVSVLHYELHDALDRQLHVSDLHVNPRPLYYPGEP